MGPILLGLAILLLLVIALSIYVTIEAYYFQWLLGPELERDLGFHEGSTYLRVGRRLHSAVVIKTVVENGPFAIAGFVAGDVLPDLSHTDLFKRLHRGRGSVVDFLVVDGGEGPPFHQRSKRKLTVVVPLRHDTQ